MSKQQLQEAIDGFTIALTKLSTCIHDALIDPTIHETNSPSSSKPTPASIVTTVTETTSGDLDDEGRPWIDGLHAATKTTMNSPEVKGAKKWKFARGTTQEQKDAYHAEYPLNNDAPAPTSAPVTLPTLPESSNKPTPANLPNLPGVKTNVPSPSLPVEDASAEVRKDILTSLQALVEIGVSWDDLKEMFIEEFKSAQNGEEITLGSIPTNKYADVNAFCKTVLEQFESIEAMTKELYTIAGEHSSHIDAGLAAIYSKHNTEELGGVHYKDLPPVIGYVTAMLNEWREWAKG